MAQSEDKKPEEVKYSMCEDENCQIQVGSVVG